MTIAEICQTKLEQFPSFRERRFRGPLLAKLALRDLGLESKFDAGIPLTYDEIVKFASKHDSYRHEYDAVQKAHPEFRGTDYETKKVVEQRKVLGLGYEMGFHEINKKLTTI